MAFNKVLDTMPAPPPPGLQTGSASASLAAPLGLQQACSGFRSGRGCSSAFSPFSWPLSRPATLTSGSTSPMAATSFEGWTASPPPGSTISLHMHSTRSAAASRPGGGQGDSRRDAPRSSCCELQSRTGGWRIPLVVTGLAVLAMASRLLLQPATVSVLFLVLTFWLLLREEDRVTDHGVWPGWRLVVLFAVWANMDGRFVLGLGFVALIWLGRAMRRAIVRRLRSCRRPLGGGGCYSCWGIVPESVTRQRSSSSRRTADCGGWTSRRDPPATARR